MINYCHPTDKEEEKDTEQSERKGGGTKVGIGENNTIKVVHRCLEPELDVLVDGKREEDLCTVKALAAQIVEWRQQGKWVVLSYGLAELLGFKENTLDPLPPRKPRREKREKVEKARLAVAGTRLVEIQLVSQKPLVVTIDGKQRKLPTKVALREMIEELRKGSERGWGATVKISSELRQWLGCAARLLDPIYD